jgi:hypothetical protein
MRALLSSGVVNSGPLELRRSFFGEAGGRATARAASGTLCHLVPAMDVAGRAGS